VLRHFELAFSEPIWEWAKILLVGAILALGSRTVTATLRVMGLSQERQFQNYHRVLNRAKWSSRSLNRILLRLLVRAFVPAERAIVLGRMTISSVDVASRSPPKASIVTRLLRASRFFQNQRLALGEPDAAHSDTVGQAHLGLGVLDRLGALRALSSGARDAPQETD
jgi:hypothetical protein